MSDLYIFCTGLRLIAALLWLLNYPAEIIGRFRSSSSRSSPLRNRSTHIERESPSELVLEEPSSTVLPLLAKFLQIKETLSL